MTATRNCINCGKPTTPENIPFCSKRCKDVDLARWFRGDYSVPVIEGEDLPDDSEENGGNIH